VIERILPACVTAVERRKDPSEVHLFPEESALIANAVDKRRREFSTARMCAREALQALGFAPSAIPAGSRGEPLWPTGALGSITHCAGYRAAAVARTDELLTLGIDAEPNAALPEGLLDDIALPDELPVLRTLAAHRPEVHWDRLLFSAKESVYKAWFPLEQRWLGFEDARLSIDLDAGTFQARLLVPAPLLPDGPLRGFSGRWVVCDGIVLTAIAPTVA
jgi:4'-phosphopantetheinyl transferase EntD